MQDAPLDSDLQPAFDGLRRELEPPSDLESRAVAGLRVSGRLRRSRRSSRLWRAVAALLVFAGGFALGRGAQRTDDAAPKAQYLLLLYGTQSLSRDVGLARVAEYSAWARAEATSGRVVGGEELGDDVAVFGAAAEPRGEPSGYFLIAATSHDEAEATAARCPHLRHGGTVVLRSIVSGRSH
jgi:hypothetical protein